MKILVALMFCLCVNLSFAQGIQDISGVMAELAMFNADQYFEFGLVPAVDITTTATPTGIQVTLHQEITNTLDIGKTTSVQLKELISEQDWAHMNIFQFLFGQYDRYLGSISLTPELKPVLANNFAVANVEQFVFDYSPNKAVGTPWVPIAYEDSLPDSPANQPIAHVFQNQSTLADIEHMHKAFGDLDYWTQRDIEHGFCRIYQKMLWRQMYAVNEYLGTAFSPVISQELLDELRDLKADVLMSFWPVLPYAASEQDLIDYRELVQTFVAQTLRRRDMIVRYFEHHPEGIRELNPEPALANAHRSVFEAIVK